MLSRLVGEMVEPWFHYQFHHHLVWSSFQLEPLPISMAVVFLVALASLRALLSQVV